MNPAHAKPRRPAGASPLRLLCPLAALALGGCASAGFAPVDLRTEYRVDPAGVGAPAPRLSWALRAGDARARDLRQGAYQVRVEAAAAPGRTGELLWDSGEVASSATSQVAYAGRPLASGEACTWSVRVRGADGLWSGWSAPARWSEGILSPAGWSARWIGTGETEPAGAQENTLADPWLRREVTLAAAPTRATAYVASVGYHELYVNGQKAGTAVLMPSVADNSRRARYVAYDITGLLHPGANALGLWLGTGWSIFPAFATGDKPRAPIARAQFDLAMPDGTQRRIATDAGWRTHPSPSTLLGSWKFMDYGGELYDAGREAAGWASPGFDDRGWRPAAEYAPALEVSAEGSEPNRLEAALAPVALSEPLKGVYRFDMGRNFSGWVELSVRGVPGDRVELEFSERPEAAVTHRIHSAYVIGPAGAGVFRNRFNYSVGRWVTVRGLRALPALGDLRAWQVRPDFDPASTFECSDPLLNRIYATSLWTLENLTLGGYLVDCPHRERMGYGGDAHATTVTALMNFRTEAFFTKWAEDWRDVQAPGDTVRAGRPDPGGGFANLEPGSLPYTAPTYWGGGGPAWSGYCVHLPWELYRHTGDTQILAQSFGTIQAWLGFLESKASGNLLRRWGGEWDFLGDWLWPGAKGMNNDSRETLLFNNCYWVYNLSCAAKIARALGRDEQALIWEERAAAVRRAINREFFRPAEASYADGTQASLGIALLADVPPPEARARVWSRLQDRILVTDKGHIGAGITGGAALFKALIDAHRNDLLYTMVSQPDYPGWGDLLGRGETTFGESWDGHDSLLHSSYLYVGAWFIKGVLGIQPGDDGHGFQSFTVRPGPVDRPALSWARGHYDCLQGRIEVSWRRTGDRFELEATVPPNASARIWVPAGAAGTVTEGGAPLQGAPGVTSVAAQDGCAVVAVRSGTYHFQSTLAAPAR